MKNTIGNKIRKDYAKMGMAASQARFLALTARKNNVEFEGQQINQQRTTLSNESAAYYSELCNLVVPTPPSVDDYTKVSYTFDDGALTNTITTMVVKNDGMYSINYLQQWQDDYSIVAASSSIIAEGTDAATGASVYKIGASTLRKLGDTAGYNMSSDPYLSSLDADQLSALLEEEEYYKAMLNEYDTNNPASGQEWYVRYVKNPSTGSYSPYFYNENEVANATYFDGYATSNVRCFGLGSAMKTKEVLNATGSVEKDSSGRYVAIELFQMDANGDIAKDADGNPISSKYTLVTNTTTDEDAYNDAMNQYHYAQYQYEQKIQNINSKIEVVQQQDKSLELELKQLDTEEQAISTEMEAVKKVVSKNVDSSFKTFNA